MPPLFPLTLALYAVACTLYCVAVAQPALAWPARLARPLLVLGFCSQAADIAWLCLHGQHPGSSAREAIYFLSWLLAGAFPVLTWRQPIPLLGALLLPLAIVMDVLARLMPGHVPSGVPGAIEFPRGAFIYTIHIVCATSGIALFGVAAAAGVVYILAERRLKQHRPGALTAGARKARSGPGLETLDGWNRKSLAIGFLLYTIALITGTLVLVQSPALAAAHATGGGLGQIKWMLGRPQYMLAILTWVLFAGLLVARGVAGLRGRRAAWVTLYGFATTLGVLLAYLWRDVSGATP